MLCAAVAEIIPDTIAIVALACKAQRHIIGKAERLGRLQFHQAEVAERDVHIAVIVSANFRHA